MTRLPHSLLATLVATSTVVTGALGWFGWRVLDQQRTIDARRVQEQAGTKADAMAAAVRGRLAEVGDQLSGWLSSPASAPPAIDGAVVLTKWAGGQAVTPRGGLPFLPKGPSSLAQAATFAEGEALEFVAKSPDRAATIYRALTNSSDPGIQASAFLRLARVLRGSGDLRGALSAYGRLTGLDDVVTDGLPASLIGLDGQRLLYAALGDVADERRAADLLLTGLDNGRWPLVRGQAEFYRDGLTAAPRPASWALAEAVADAWAGEDGHFSSRGQRVVTRDHRGVIVLWRSNGPTAALMVTFAQPFLAPLAPSGSSWLMLDAEGRPLSGDDAAAADAVSRVVGTTDGAWTLRVWPTSPASIGDGAGRAGVLTMMVATLIRIWGATYFMARSIRSEAAVARLQSDFVAAVSHEFRSPLTTVRQMAEMLEMGRIAHEPRRQQYYRALVAEATRLQRLVETLLNFGRLEAGTDRYARAAVDVAALVDAVIADVGRQADGSAAQIEAIPPAAAVQVHADNEAIQLALRNLVDNAVKYSPAGSLVRVLWRADGDRAAIDVVDRGPGIASNERQVIFQKFARGQAARDAHVAGTGVGLAIVRHIVSAHGGEIQLESQIGQGSTFTMWLPAFPPDRISAGKPAERSRLP